MRSAKQIAASRANGARSKGPVTAAGKRNSSKNSTRHGIFADTLVLEQEDPAQFHELLNELLDEHQPSTPTQMMLVETVVAARWRQRRIWALQKTNFDYDIASITTNSENPALRAVQALRTNEESIRSHELLLRFEIALDRQISRALHRLQQSQDRSATRKEESITPPATEPKESAKAPTTASDQEPIARTEVSRTSRKEIPAERTQQPIETTAPVSSNARPVRPITERRA